MLPGLSYWSVIFSAAWWWGLEEPIDQPHPTACPHSLPPSKPLPSHPDGTTMSMAPSAIPAGTQSPGHQCKQPRGTLDCLSDTQYWGRKAVLIFRDSGCPPASASPSSWAMGLTFNLPISILPPGITMPGFFIWVPGIILRLGALGKVNPLPTEPTPQPPGPLNLASPSWPQALALTSPPPPRLHPSLPLHSHPTCNSILSLLLQEAEVASVCSLSRFDSEFWVKRWDVAFKNLC